MVLLVVSGHASMAMATDASTVTTYTPESVTSHYVGWWYALQVCGALGVMTICRMSWVLAPSSQEDGIAPRTVRRHRVQDIEM